MKNTLLLLLTFGIFTTTFASSQDSTQSSFWKKIKPNSVNFQYAGNIGMFSAGPRYESPNQKWQLGFSYGFVPSSFSDKPIHSITAKAYFIPIKREINDLTQLDALKIGLFYNRSLGDEYFFKLPKYYDKGYYYFPTAGNIGLTLGSEIKHKRWGFYYEAVTTEKILINFAKSPKSVDFYELFSLGFGVTYHLK